MDANDLMDEATRIMLQAQKTLERFHSTLEQIEDDEILSQSIIGEEMEQKNLLVLKRERVRRCEDQLLKARTRKEACDAAVVAKVAALATACPVLGEGVVQSFQIGGANRYQTTMAPVGVRGLTIEVPFGGDALSEKETARLAHNEYCECVHQLRDARADLSRFENELRQLQQRIECFGDL